MKYKKLLIALFIAMLGTFMLTSPAFSANPLAKWAPDFNPKGAKYKCIVSNVSHPVIIGVMAGFEMRDEIWKRTKGQIYFDYKPLSILGGEVEVLNMLQMGAIQGMGVSSVASTNLGPRMGLANFPFLLDTYEKLEKFISNKKLYEHFLNGMGHQGITGLDITGYGNYGWATKTPVRSIDDLKNIKLRIAEAAVNRLSYKSWGINPVPMPWPDVPIALKQGVITGLDHTLSVCYITKKFEDVKYFTRINYAHGMFIWIFNSRWLNKLPKDLRTTFIQTVKDVCADNRARTPQWEIKQLEGAKTKAGVEFFQLPANEMTALKNLSQIVYNTYAPEINKTYPTDKYKPQDYLKEVRGFLGK
jgi:TRAP-type C4-dicarboxylate transport system substrate-binding protein